MSTKSTPRAATECRRPFSFLGTAGRELHAEAWLAGEAANEREFALALLFQPSGQRHFADGDLSAKLGAQAAIGKVRALCHRRHDDSPGQSRAKTHRAILLVLPFEHAATCFHCERGNCACRRPQPCPGTAKSFLWTIDSPGAPPSYLMGSLHVLTPGRTPLSPRIEEAFKASKVLITEADIDAVNDPATMMGFIGKALLTDRTLDQVIAADLYKAVIDRAGKAGLPRAAIQRMKPWFAAIALTAPALQSAGFKAEFGIDKHFYDRAKKDGAELRALETVAFQFDRMDQMSPADQEALLRSTVDDLDTQTSNVKTIADAWVKGDTAALEKLLLASMKTSPELYQRMLVERNANWVAGVEACITQNLLLRRRWSRSPHRHRQPRRDAPEKGLQGRTTVALDMRMPLQDLSHALRSLRRRPGFTVAAILTLTVGLGANVTVFSIVNAMLLRPLPFGERSNRIVTLHSTHRMQNEDWGWGDSELSYRDLQDLGAAQSFAGLGGYLPRNFTLTGEDRAERVQGGSVTPDLFAVLGISPVMGRDFLPEDAAPPGLESSVILTHGLWQRRYGADPGIVGRSVVINDRARTVVGVMPPNFKFPERDELYMALRWDEAPRAARNVNVVGILRDGVTIDQAQDEVAAIAQRLSETYPETNRGFGVRVLKFRESQVGGDERALSAALMAAVGFVLLIACANLANLLLVRSAARQREIAVRAAMGASRWQLSSHVLSEAVVLSLAGTALGLLASQWSLDVIRQSFPEELPYWMAFDIDTRILLFALLARRLHCARDWSAASDAGNANESCE